MKLIFATHNQHKVEELKKLVPASISILSLADINCHHDIKETGATLEENAEIKANFIKYKYGLDCFADDSGLEIESLQEFRAFASRQLFRYFVLTPLFFLPDFINLANIPN